ncbi:MAG: ATP-binding protein [Verrucomicrobia bacterium]|nr:ATP-binding protein [Verrucomicrobiota bacterium]
MLSILSTISVSLYAIVGGPSVGKTSIIQELKNKGEIVCEEAATDIILEERRKGNTTPWTEEGFEVRIFDEKVKREKEASLLAKDQGKSTVFTDRGLLDSLYYLEINQKKSSKEYETIASVLKELHSDTRYDAVFYIEPYNGEDFTSTVTEHRHEDTAEAKKQAKHIKEIYEKTPMPLIIVPAHMTPKARANFVLEEVKALQKASK